MAIMVTENWSEKKLYPASGGWRGSRGFIVTGVTTEAAAVAAVVSFDARTAFNAQHPQSSLLYVDGQPCDRVGFGHYHVGINYSSNPAGRHVDPANPLTEPYRYYFDWGSTTEGCDRDTYGNPIQNTAREAFSDLIPTDVLNGWMFVERNEPYYDAIQAVNFANAVNNADVTFFSSWLLHKGQACCRRIVPTTPITSAAVYVTVKYAIELRRGFKLDSDGYYDGFKVRILNAGRRGFWNNTSGTAISGPIIEWLNGAAQNVGQDVRLDNVGKPMESNYEINTTVWPFHAAAVACPVALPATTVIEKSADPSGAAIAYFVKQFPETVTLKDLSTLGL
jgi:hypothetical protein